MFKKLLKRDLKYLTSVWWILAVVTLVANLIGAVCLRIAPFQTTPFFLLDFAEIGIFVAIGTMIALVVLSIVRVIRRFSQNLFSDEGYLTFLIPVKRKTLYYSKLLAGCLLFLFDAVVLTICLTFYVIIEQNGSAFFGSAMSVIITLLTFNTSVSVYQIIIAAINFCLMILALVTFIYYTRTVHALRIRNSGAKKVAGIIIGVVIGVDLLSSILLTNIFSFDLSVMDMLDKMPVGRRMFYQVLSSLSSTAVLATIFGLCYARTLYLIENKLNLS